MTTLSSYCSAAVLSFAATFNQGVYAQDIAQNDAQIVSDAAAVFERIRDVPDLTNPEGQCVTAAQLGQAPTSYIQEKVQRLTGILARDEVGADLVQALHDNDTAVCFAPMDDYTEAKHYPDSDVIVLNQMAREGCLISAFAHESHHAAQDVMGITAPIKDLEQWDNQEKLILAVERDAATIQTMVSWRLAQPEYTAEPYEGALDCLNNRFAVASPYFAQAANALDNIQASHPEWIDNGQAARHVYEVFATNRTHWVHNSMPFRELYTCEGSQDTCYRGRYTLDDVGIDLDVLGTIHYDTDYRQIPYDEALGARPVNEGRSIPRYVPLP